MEACLANECVQEYIADESLPLYTLEAIQQSPVVRVEFEQAIVFGDIGSTLSATASKHWGDGPYILPVEPENGCCRTSTQLDSYCM